MIFMPIQQLVEKDKRNGGVLFSLHFASQPDNSARCKYAV